MNKTEKTNELQMQIVYNQIRQYQSNEYVYMGITAELFENLVRKAWRWPAAPRAVV